MTASMSRRALITGIGGQDGSYLAELLSQKGYEVHGTVRRAALEDPVHRLARLAHLRDRITLHASSVESFSSLHRVVAEIEPHECYHFAAQSFVNYSFDDEFATLNININGTHNLLTSLKQVVPECRFFLACSSEMFGNVASFPQNEQTPFHPRSPYGISKVCAYDLARNYREAYGMFAVSGILFNHESPRRGFEFVTRKISSGIARILAGQATELPLGSLDSRRDWGHAREYVEAMWRMLQLDSPEDFVIATGVTHSVRDFCETAFASVDLDYRRFVVVDQQFYRPPDGELLVGDITKARALLNWTPTVSFKDLVGEMVREDVRHAAESVHRLGVPQAQ